VYSGEKRSKGVISMTIDLTPIEQEQLEAEAERRGMDPSALARSLVLERLPIAPRDGEEDPTLALFSHWDREDAALTPEEIEEARRQTREFEQNINAERVRAGSRIIYP
jgi:hypothetical protein